MGATPVCPIGISEDVVPPRADARPALTSGSLGSLRAPAKPAPPDGTPLARRSPPARLARCARRQSRRLLFEGNLAQQFEVVEGTAGAVDDGGIRIVAADDRQAGLLAQHDIQVAQ